MGAELAVINQVKGQTVRVPKSVVTGWGGFVTSQFFYNPDAARYSLSGAVTANTLKTLLSITGPGRLDIAAATSNGTTSRTHRMKITLDGTVVFDYTTSAVTTDNVGIIGCGYSAQTTQTLTPISLEMAYFNKTCLVEYAGSLSETDGARTYLRYHTY